LEIARSVDGPTGADRERLANSLASKIGIAAPILLGGAPVGALPHAGATAAAEIVAGSATATSGISAAALSSSGAVKVFLAGVIGAALGLATTAPVVMLRPDASDAHPSRPSQTTPASHEHTTDHAPTTAAGSPFVSSVEGAIQSPGPHAPIKATSAAIGVAHGPATRSKAAASLTREAELLAAVQSELRANNPERALALLDEHERAYSGGALSEERQAVRVLALCQAGKWTAARHEAVEFLQTAPRSPLVPRIQSSCAFTAQGAPALRPEPAQQRSPAGQ
jgi:hypothetical protein